MKILIVSHEGDYSGCAFKLAFEGNQVFWYVQDKKMKPLLTGVRNIFHIDDYHPYLKEVDFILFDSTGFGEEQDALRKKGLKVIGGSSFGDRLEIDRDFGQEVAKEFGLNIPQTISFSSMTEVEKYVQQVPAAYVLKSSGEDLPTYATYVSSTNDGSDLVEFGYFLERKFGRKIRKFELCEKIDGVEIGIAAYFDGQKFLKPYNINYEHKRFGTGHETRATIDGVGQNTGELGTVMVNTTKVSPLVEQLLRFAPLFARANHVGIIDINFIRSKKDGKFYFLEWTSRFGYPSCMIEQSLNPYNLTDDFVNILAHRDLYWQPNVWTVGIVLASQGFPNEDAYNKEGRGLPILGIDEVMLHTGYFYPWEFEMDGEQMITSAGIGASVVVCGIASDLAKAQENAYNNVKKVKIPNVYYRTDIGDRVLAEMRYAVI